MSAIREQLLFFSAACMSMLWRFALTTSIATSLFITLFPSWGAVFCLSIGALLSAYTSNRNWRIIQVLLIHLVGLGGTITIIAHSYFNRQGYLPDFTWLVSLLFSERTPLQWFSLFYMALNSIWFWGCGCSLITKNRSHRNICQRFDAGILCFLGLFLFRFLLDLQFDFKVDDSVSEVFLIPFFLCSILGLALAGNSSRGHKEFTPGNKGVGIIISFALMVLGTAAVSLSVLQPILIWSAETGYRATQTVMEPLWAYFTNALLFLFAPRKTYQASQAKQSSEKSSSIVLQEDSWLSDSAQEIFSYLFVGMQALLLVVGLLFLTWLLSRWLISRTSTGKKHRDKNQSLILFRICIYRIFFLMKNTLKLVLPIKDPTAEELFNFLLGWGHYSGVSYLSSETACEYGCRLQYHFPELNDEIQHIVGAFTKQIYSKNRIPLSELAAAQSALNNIRSPRHWKMRIKMMIIGHT